MFLGGFGQGILGVRRHLDDSCKIDVNNAENNAIILFVNPHDTHKKKTYAS